MLGQGKNVWQAEIDAAAEVSSSFPLRMIGGYNPIFVLVI